MSIFVRQPTSEELSKFKKALNNWSKEKTGALEAHLGDRAKIESSKSCEVYSVAIDTLIEDRTTEPKSAPSKKNQLNTAPTVAHGSTNVWSKPSPKSLSLKFEETVYTEEIPGTEFYSACKDCNERGNTDCPTCGKTGKLVCGQCHGTRKHDCLDCNGYGSFTCTECVQGMVEISCSACDRGKIACDGCGGSGSHFSLREGKSYECRQCNGSGKRTCLVCGGSDSETVRCNKCSNGSIPCKTCRTQKVVTCSTCDQNGHVNCSKCRGKSVLDCTPCQTQGGFRNVEHLVYKSTIESNEMVLSPLENIRDKIRLSFQDQTELMQPRLALEEINKNISQTELQGAVEQIFTHVNQNRPTSTLLERFKLKKAVVLDVSFKYEDQDGHAFHDSHSSLTYVDVNPLTNKASKAHEELKAAYKVAKAKEDITGARKLIERARELKLKTLLSSWQHEIDELEKKIHVREATAYRKTVMLPVLYSLGPVIWLAAGFITPMSLTTLLIFSLVGLSQADSSSLKLEDGKAAHQKLFKEKVITLGLICLSVVLLGLAIKYFQTESPTDFILKRGVPLSGEAQ